MADAARAPLEELSLRLGVERSVVERWLSLGLLQQRDGAFDDRAVERGRLLVYLEARGVSAEVVADVFVREGELLDEFVDLLGGDRGEGCSLEEAAQRAGLDPQLARRFWVASGFGDRHELFDEDVEAVAAAARALQAGLPPEALLQLVRVFGDALVRVADAQGRLFHFYVHEQLRSSGLTGSDLLEATMAVSEPLLGLVERPESAPLPVAPGDPRP